ncbi:hypothetical protein BLNAU_10949 [Blattamonas nauphoetae]|uniref:Uncharacterized protein n=1 Tax=Blattamonas nauphoetae TaxID=2049346 RepID=A0ABQ9XSL5_9EUKA|nr:hypothetical protein BLNAU_10949 [Blattamonas nauphoetae]
MISSDEYFPFQKWSTKDKVTANSVAQAFLSLVSMVRDDFQFSKKLIRKTSSFLSSVTSLVLPSIDVDDLMKAIGQGSTNPTAVILSIPLLRDLSVIADKDVLSGILFILRDGIQISSTDPLYSLTALDHTDLQSLRDVSLLSKVEHEGTNQSIFWFLLHSINRWETTGAETAGRGGILLLTLEREGEIVKVEAADCFERSLRDLDWGAAVWFGWGTPKHGACIPQHRAADLLDASIASVHIPALTPITYTHFSFIRMIQPRKLVGERTRKKSESLAFNSSSDSPSSASTRVGVGSIDLPDGLTGSISAEPSPRLPTRLPVS